MDHLHTRRLGRRVVECAHRRVLFSTLVALACSHLTNARAQQPAPAGADQAAFAAKRFPQPVRVGDLMHRTVLAPTESRSVLGHVAFVIRLNDGEEDIVIKFGGILGLGSRNIAVPLDAMVLLGEELEVLDLTPKQLRGFATYGGDGRMLGDDETIQMGLAHPSH